MKRINLSVDLSDNEVFEKSVKEAVTSQVKTMVRNEFDYLVTSTVTSEIDRLSKSSCIEQRCRAEISTNRFKDLVKDVLYDLDLTSIIENAINDLIKVKVDKALSDIDKQINETIKDVLNEKVKMRLYDIFNK